MKFKRGSGTFRCVYEAEEGGETEIFVPRLQYPNGYDVEVEGGEAARDEENQSLRVHAVGSSKVAVTITRR
jgi:hypothetical protein